MSRLRACGMGQKALALVNIEDMRLIQVGKALWMTLPIYTFPTCISRPRLAFLQGEARECLGNRN